MDQTFVIEHNKSKHSINKYQHKFLMQTPANEGVSLSKQLRCIFQSSYNERNAHNHRECRSQLYIKGGDAPPAVHFCEPNAPKRDQPHTSKAMSNQKESERKREKRKKKCARDFFFRGDRELELDTHVFSGRTNWCCGWRD
jgi:hypothetical protein